MTILKSSEVPNECRGFEIGFLTSIWWEAEAHVCTYEVAHPLVRRCRWVLGPLDQTLRQGVDVCLRNHFAYIASMTIGMQPKLSKQIRGDAIRH